MADRGSLKTSGAQVQFVFQHFDLEKVVVIGDPLPEDPDVPGRVVNGQRGKRSREVPSGYLPGHCKRMLGKRCGDVSTGVSVDLVEEWVVERTKGLVFEDAVPGIIAGK
ncbi:hypothetical protein BDM02DRAFT_3107135 [Thelephora ganbajun]|uniref:Uncharacterized protein n=1 Tax=Thelephora ganbajun TaxID=370292 RepID=A0ACB6ZX54_THEGA|nr:hypothetical protein BDM02DRAFT_3107135 [Thelephora ganbajun]